MKKGITLAILSVVMLLMIILVTAVTTTGASAINNSRKVKFASELALVQELVDEYASKKDGDFPVSSSIEVDLSNVTPNAITQFDDETKNGSKIILYEVDFSLLGKTDLIYGNKEKNDITDIYALSKESGKVYYVKGVKAGNNTYYTLTDDLKLSMDYTENSGTIAKDGIIFNVENSKWTNKNIDSYIKVPSTSEYTDVLVSVIQGGSAVTINVTESKKEYDIYHITGVSGNYEISVNYTKNNVKNFQNFNVTNHDNEAPKFIVKDTKQMLNEKDNVKQTYINVEIENDVSGIKYAKYETENIDNSDAKQYFTNNGMKILNGTIIVDKYTKYVTIFVEDNAGNFTTEIVTLDTVLSEKDYVTEGLLLHYDGINNTGSGHSNSIEFWKDLTGNGNDAKLVGIEGNESSGWMDNGLKLDGINDYVYRNMNVDPNKATVEITYKYYDGVYVFMSNVNQVTSIDNSARAIKGDSVQYEWSNSIDESKINNVSLSWYKSQNSLFANTYINSKKVGEGNFENDTQGKYIVLGSSSPNSAQQLSKMDIYSVRIYNRALSQEEIKQNYKIDKARFGI